MSSVNFARNLVKGKIAETIFAQMHREAGNFTVLEFGYEKIIPELVQQGYNESNITIRTLKTAPDFAVIDKKTKRVQLVEVKYMRSINLNYVLKDAQGMSESWNPSFLFIAAFDGFYFDNIETIIKNNGNIPRLKNSRISLELQNKYLKILTDFEASN